MTVLIWISRQAGLAARRWESTDVTPLVKLHFLSLSDSVRWRPVAQIAAADSKSLALVFTDDILSGQASSPLFYAPRGRRSNLPLIPVAGPMLISMQSWLMNDTPVSCQIALWL